MARRVIIGNDGGGRFRIRTSLPGHDAATAPLDGLLFDADAMPGRVLSEGERYCGWYGFNQDMDIHLPYVTTFPHYASGSFIIAAIARPMYADGSDGGGDWYMKGSQIKNGVRNNYSYLLPYPAKGNYITPFFCSGDYGGGVVYIWGFTLEWDGANITIRNYLHNGLWLRGPALVV